MPCTSLVSFRIRFENGMVIVSIVPTKGGYLSQKWNGKLIARYKQWFDNQNDTNFSSWTCDCQIIIEIIIESVMKEILENVNFLCRDIVFYWTVYGIPFPLYKIIVLVCEKLITSLRNWLKSHKTAGEYFLTFLPFPLTSPHCPPLYPISKHSEYLCTKRKQCWW